MREFLENLLRYPRFLLGLILGIFLAFFASFKPLFQNPVTAIAAIGMLVGGLAFLVFTLRAMLGLSPA
jgi:hypothetical protein